MREGSAEEAQPIKGVCSWLAPDSIRGGCSWLEGVPVIHIEVGVDRVPELPSHEVESHLKVIRHEVLHEQQRHGEWYEAAW